MRRAGALPPTGMRTGRSGGAGSWESARGPVGCSSSGESTRGESTCGESTDRNGGQRQHAATHEQATDSDVEQAG